MYANVVNNGANVRRVQAVALNEIIINLAGRETVPVIPRAIRSAADVNASWRIFSARAQLQNSLGRTDFFLRLYINTDAIECKYI